METIKTRREKSAPAERSEAANFAQSKIDVNVHLSLQPQSRGRRTDSPESVLFAYNAFALGT